MKAPYVISMLAVAGMLGLSSSDAFAAESFKGTIKSVGAQTIVLAVDSQEHQFKVAPDATITVDDKEAAFADLMPGFKAEVTADKSDDGGLVASRIRAESVGWVPPDLSAR